MMTERHDWRQANEDNVSTGSGNSDTALNLPQGSSSESILLRMPNVRRILPSESKQKAVITALAFTVLLIVCSVFGTLYYSSESGGSNKDVKNAEHSMEHEIFVRDISGEDASVRKDSEHSNSAEENRDDLMLNDQPQIHAQPFTQLQSSISPHSGNSTRRRTKSKKRTRPNHGHGPRKLPANAQEADAFSLLYQMHLVHGQKETFTNKTECKDEDLDGRKIFKGWKSFLQVNLTAAGITSDHPNVFKGYGNREREARRRAAQNALTTLYPGQLVYAGKNDYEDIDEFCN